MTATEPRSRQWVYASPLDDAPYPPARTIADLVRVLCQMRGGVSALAQSLDMSHGDLSRMASGKLRPSPKVLAELGFKKVELYIPDDCPAPALGYPYKATS